MKLDSAEQQGVLLELIARAHRSADEVPTVEAIRKAIVEAEVPKPEPAKGA